jgi:hypothetical protein
MSELNQKQIFYTTNRFTGDYSVSDILQYNISSDTIEKVSALSDSSKGGVALKGKDSKTIYYFGGGRTRKVIHKFSPETKVTKQLITILPSDFDYGAGVTINSSCFLFNAPQRNILEFDLDHETVKIIGELSFGARNQIASTASITDGTSNKVWLFPGHSEELDNHVMIFNPETKLVSKPLQNVSGPSLYYKPATVSTGRYGYIIGGIGNVPETDGSKHPYNGILRYTYT